MADRSTTGPGRRACPAAIGTALALGLLGLGLLALPGLPREAVGARAPYLVPERPGPALREAVRLWRDGEAAEAARRFAAVARRHRLVADHATHLRVQALLAAGRPDDAIAAAYPFERDHGDSPVRAQLFAALGNAYRDVGDEPSARSAWSKALAAGPDRARRAGLSFALAESLERSGETQPALALHRELWRGHPGLETDAASAAALERLGGSGAIAAADWVARGEALYAARDNEGALAAYDRALAAGELAPKRRRAVARQRAFTLFRLRRYPEATAAFEALTKSVERQFWLARCYARLGQIPRSVAAFEAIGRGRGSFALRSRFLAGTLLAGEGEPGRAEVHFSAVAAASRSADQRRAARWRLGWTAYRDGRQAEAERQLVRLVADEADPLERLRARYWLARAREEQGKVEAAEAFAEMALEYPFTYYGIRAAARVHAELPERAAPTFDEERSLSLDAERLERLRVLLEADLVEESLVEIGLLARRSRSLADRLEIARLYADAGDFHRAQRAVLDVHLERLARGPAPGREDLWWFAYPWAFPADLEVAAAAAGVEPSLVLAVMREESGFRPAVISAVGARGLLQIMPATGQNLAAELGRAAFDPEELFRPETNLRFGAHYLSRLLARFDGDLAAAVASYNAGPEAVARWRRERPGLPADEWVEAIPYDQTRGYVKRVLRSLHAYRVLY